mmetsp:Transcript_37870/g.46109  ORF Transcript_37870/g.46109 Transcript_37870/m.46109 type:complete len:263 (+) Transcript_37870:3-791(+)
MSKKDDWCSKKGMKARKKGIKKLESKSRKWCYFAFFCASFIIYIICGAVYSPRSSNALAITAAFAEDKRLGKTPAYDTCQFPSFVKDESVTDTEFVKLVYGIAEYCRDRPKDCEKGTQWMGAFVFNAACLFVTAINFIVLMFGAFFFYPRYFGTMCNLCYGCCHCSAFITALAVRFNPYGLWCSVNIAGNKYEGMGSDGKHKWSDEQTYQSDGNVLAMMASIQAVLWCFQCYCCCVPLLQTPIYDKKDKSKAQVNQMPAPMQ